jgi:hypothetical protein
MIQKAIAPAQLSLFPLAEPKPKGKKAKIDDLVDGIFVQCESIDLEPLAILIELKQRDVNNFLARLSRNDREQFIAKLLYSWLSETSKK